MGFANSVIHKKKLKNKLLNEVELLLFHNENNSYYFISCLPKQ